jgi:hypothetical protein
MVMVNCMMNENDGLYLVFILLMVIMLSFVFLLATLSLLRICIHLFLYIPKKLVMFLFGLFDDIKWVLQVSINHTSGVVTYGQIKKRHSTSLDHNKTLNHFI